MSALGSAQITEVHVGSTYTQHVEVETFFQVSSIGRSGAGELGIVWLDY